MLVNEIMNEIEIQSYEEFMKNYDDLEYEKSFSNNETIKHPRRKNGLISTYDLLDELTSYGDPVNDFEKFIGEYGNMEVLEDQYDNTYNYNGYLDNYVNFSIFDLENDQTLVTLSVCLSLDPRGAYTKSVAFIFESKYDFMETFSKTFQLLGFEFTANGRRLNGSFDAGALSEYGYLYITDQNNEEVYYDEALMDTTDVEDISSVVAELLEIEKVTIEKINYFWYASQ